VEVLSQISLKPYSWWRIGGPAEHFCLPKTIEEVQAAVILARERGWHLTVLGGGTNVLIPDQGLSGLVVGMREMTGLQHVERDGRLVLEAFAGTPKSELTKIFLRNRLAPALFLCGLPGDVGGGVVMNAGVSEAITPREFVELVDWVEYVDLSTGELRRRSKHELKWTYRRCDGWQPGLIVKVGLSWPLTPDTDLHQRVKDATKRRLERQPLDKPSCGSTFKNPPGAHAGALIEQCGLKGYRVGDAQVSTKHANFIVNLGAATAVDVKAVIQHVKLEVLKKFGVELELEVRML